MATNIKYSDLISEVLPYLAAYPSDTLAENAIKRAAIEFCSGSMIWKHLPDAMDVIAGENEYILELPQGAEVSMVLNVSLDGAQLDPKTVDWLDSQCSGWLTDAAKPDYYTQIESEKIILAPLPSETVTAGLVLSFALQPSLTSTSFPKWIFSKFPYAITDGALAKLMLIPNKPWTDIQNGSDRRSRFESAIGTARESSSKALGRAPIRSTSYH